MASDGLVKFRASTVGNLLVGGNAITDRQLARLNELEARSNNPDAKPLTPSMQQELSELVAKRDGGFRFGATAMAYIRDCWLRNTYGYEEPVVTNELLKGYACEDEIIGVLNRQVPGEFRTKNEESFEDSHFTGTPDIIGSEWVEDVKCSWSLKTFFDVRRHNPLYYTQGQVYLALTGRKFFRLAYVLVDTPFEIVQEEKKRFYFRFDCDESNPHYLEAVAKVESMHTPSRLVPESQRIKTFEFHRDEAHISLLRQRVEQAREVYASLTLNGEPDEWQ
jgi:hypothetical protein